MKTTVIRHDIDDNPTERVRKAMIAELAGKNECTTSGADLARHMPSVHGPTRWADFLAAANAEGLTIDGDGSLGRRFTLRRSGTNSTTNPSAVTPANAPPAPKSKRYLDDPDFVKSAEAVISRTNTIMSRAPVTVDTVLAKLDGAEHGKRPKPSAKPDMTPDDPKALAAEITRIQDVMRRQLALQVTSTEALSLITARKGKSLPDPQTVARLAQLHVAEEAERGKRVTTVEAISIVERQFPEPAPSPVSTQAKNDREAGGYDVDEVSKHARGYVTAQAKEGKHVSFTEAVVHVEKQLQKR